MNGLTHFFVYTFVNCMVSFFQAECYIFNSESVIVIGGEAYKNSYFSYSLLLQSGEGDTLLIVGAPKNSNTSNGGGNIYKCDLQHESSCLQYPIGNIIDTHIVNGNFFGGSLDGSDITGGSFVACAPRHFTADGRVPRLKGYCVHMKNNSENYQEIKPFLNTIDYPDISSSKESYYDFAFAMLGFDVSYYSENEILFGVPGAKKFNGATISLTSRDGVISHLMPSRRFPSFLDEDTYFGYAVKVAKFQKSDVWYLAGAPRANDLRGKVTLYYYNIREKEKMHIVASFDGEEVGAYFGATLLVSDVDNDDLADIMIGAPTAGGKTWDEGAVYVYKGLNGKSFTYQTKLTGSSSAGARFGTALVTLGDLDLDGFNDIAVSAPYENGIGAVYVYMGSKGGLLSKYSQKIVPSDFKMIGGPSPKGFGLGLSRGNDIDGNGHNDIAIGAYKTDQVFIVKAYSVVDYRTSLFSSIPSITSDIKEFNIQLCLVTTKRSSTKTVTQVDFNISIELDYRSVERKIEDRQSVQVESNSCKDYLISLKKSSTDIFPFSIVLNLNVVSENIVAHGDKSLELSVPYSHECGNDDICLTDLSLQLKVNRENFVLGADKDISLVVSVNNNGEPAYQCRVLLVIPSGFDLRNPKDCVQTEGNYSCLISEILKGSSERKFVLDVKNVKPDTELIAFYAEVNSLGKNNPAAESRVSLDLPVALENTPFINGKSTPEYAELELSQSLVENFDVTYQFTLGKNGPSPLFINVDIWFPLEEYNGENIFTITEIEGTVGNIRMGCQSTVEATGTNDDGNSTIGVNFSENRTIALKCDQGRTCVKYSCEGEYLESSSQFAVFTVRSVINFKLLGLKHKESLSSEDLIAYIPVAYQTSSTGRVEKSILFLIFVHLENYVPLWVYLVAAIGGILLLILLSYGLYKCHFFDRIYKEKLEQEKTLLSPAAYDLVVDGAGETNYNHEYL